MSESIRSFLVHMMTVYFTLVTLITIAILLLGLYMEPEAEFGYSAFAEPLILAACGTLPCVVMISRHELNLKAYMLRKIMQLILIELLVIWVSGARIEDGSALQFAISILVIFLCAHGISWLQECYAARQMTADLIRLQEKAGGV